MLVLRVVVLLAMLLALPYIRGAVYDFPEPSPFRGAHLLNPYAGATDPWQRANLHAHGRPWGGLTSGRQTASDVVRAYRAMGYSVAGISDYHSIAAEHGVPTFPVYEHGYSLLKRHQLAIGARRVDWFDFPLWQTLSHQQFVIDRVAATADLIALAHPPSRDAYTTGDLERLTGYQLIEVANGPFESQEAWDAALSSGRVVWGLANDDTHDLRDLRRLGAAWTMIAAPTASTPHIVEALAAGRSYAVQRTNTIASAVDTWLDVVEARDGRLTVSCVGEPSTFAFIGQGGVLRRRVKNALSASYAFAPEDTYIRAVVETPRATLYLNPVLRFDGVSVPAPSARVNVGLTWIMRGTLGAAGCVLLVVGLRRRRRPARSASAKPVLASPKETESF